MAVSAASLRSLIGRRAAFFSAMIGMLCVLAELCFLLPDLFVTPEALPHYVANLGVFRGLPDAYTATRYHSLAIERASLPACLEVSAWTDDGEIMGVRHKSLAVEGVQFHPESILTEHGHQLLKNFLGGGKS